MRLKSRSAVMLPLVFRPKEKPGVRFAWRTLNIDLSLREVPGAPVRKLWTHIWLRKEN